MCPVLQRHLYVHPLSRARNQPARPRCVAVDKGGKPLAGAVLFKLPEAWGKRPTFLARLDHPLCFRILTEAAMRRIRYQVAASLDGYIAGPKGESDWIVTNPEIDFGELFNQFDTALMGCSTYEVVLNSGFGLPPRMKTYVVSRTLQPREHPRVTIVADPLDARLAALRAEPGKDIWLFGGGSLFRTLAEIGLVDTVEVAIVPVLLGGGIPLLPSPAERTRLTLTSHKVYRAGIVALNYDCDKSVQPRVA